MLSLFLCIAIRKELDFTGLVCYNRVTDKRVVVCPYRQND